MAAKKLPATGYVDQVGKPLKLPERFQGTIEEFAALVAQLTPRHCSYPDGQLLSRQTGRPCRAIAMANGRCRNHGGGMPKGPDHPRFTGKRLESVLPKDIAEMVRTAVEDPNLLSIRNDVALVWSRQRILMQRLHTGESGSLWKMLNERWVDVMAANRAAAEARREEAEARLRDDALAAQAAAARLQTAVGQAQKAMDEIGKLIAQGNKDEAAWRELIGTTNNLVELKGREHARLKDLHQVVYAEDALNMASILLGVVIENVTDPHVRFRIGQRFSEIIHFKGRQGAMPALVAPSELKTPKPLEVPGEVIPVNQPPQ